MKFVYFRDATDDAYMNTVDNFAGMLQTAGDTVEVYFHAASATAGNNAGFDKVTIATVSNKEKEAMEGIAAALAGGVKAVTVVADDAASVYCEDNISSVSGIDKNAVSQNGFLAITGDTTLSAADNGKIVQCNPAATTLIQLPGAADVGAGWNVRITLTEDDGGAMAQIVNIGTKAGEFFNGILVAQDGDAGPAVANGTSNDFIQCKATATSGETFFIYSDGTRMHVHGLIVDGDDTLFADTAAS